MGEKRIKILFVLGSFKLGGGERQMIYLMKKIDRNHFDPVACFFHNDGPLIDELPEDMVTYDLTGKIRGKLSKIFHLIRIVVKVNPDVVYSNLVGTNIPLGFVGVFTPMVKRKAKYAISVVNNVDYYSKVAKQLVRLLYPRMDLVFACATGLCEQLRDMVGIPDRKLRVMYNGVDTTFIEERSSAEFSHPWLDSDVPCLITVANFLAQKKLDDLIKVFTAVNNQIPCYLLIIGDGGLRGELESLAVALGVQDRIDFLGYQYNSNKYVSRADIFVSTSSFEGMALVLLEAAIVGTPIVCTDAPFGSRDVVKDERMGIMVRVGDLESLTDGILRILSDKGVGKMVAENAREHVKKVFDLEIIVKEFEDSIKGLIAVSVNEEKST